MAYMINCQRLVDIYTPLPNQTNLPMDCCPCDFLNDTFNELFGWRNISFPSDVGGKQLVKREPKKIRHARLKCK